MHLWCITATTQGGIPLSSVIFSQASQVISRLMDIGPTSQLSEIVRISSMSDAWLMFGGSFTRRQRRAKKTGGANIGLSKIQKIYRADEALRGEGLDSQGFLAARQEQIVPLLEDFKSWLDDKATKVRPSSAFGKAISYSSGEWQKVSRFIESPYLTPDNNAAERAIRPFVLGRKNWLFSGSPRGANASCFFYSMIETAKVNELNPYGYLKWIFETAPALPKSDYENLLPWNCDRDEVNRFALQGLRN